MTQEQALEALERVLARSEFQEEEARRLWDVWLAEAGRWLYNLVIALVESVLRLATGRETLVNAVIFVVALAILVALIWYFGRAIRFSLVAESSERGRVEAARRVRAEQLWREAQALAEQGHYAEACRPLYLAALFALEEQDLLTYEEALTNREHLHRVAASHPELKEPFQALVAAYDRLRYGGQAVDGAAYSHLRALARRTAGLSA